ncbi:Pyruvate/Phosphoenolpyruvate kinase-like domain-containing protein [Tuber brumale]|nr:Pyruvate/Phosphoenolpyruvate kinase-like domain-containing protein [Tuber brumale]
MPRPGGVREVCVRINAVESGLALEDLRVVVCPLNLTGIRGGQGIVVTNCERWNSCKERIWTRLSYRKWKVREICQLPSTLIPTQSARSIIDIRQITGSTPRLSGLIFAAEDFAKDLSIIRTPSLTEFLLARQTIAMAARAYSIPSAIDLVCTSYRDVATLERECLDGVGMGFNGKQVVHPSQVDVVQRLFLPGEEQVRAAVKVLVAEKVAEAEGRGAWGLDGRMVDRPVIEAARGIVGKMEAVGVDISGVWEAEKETKPE